MMRPVVAMVVAALALTAHAAHARESTLDYGAPFGRVQLYAPDAAPTGVVLFISGEGGWNPGVAGMARRLVGQGAAVAGVDVRRYLAAIAGARDRCRYLAGDLEALAHRVQRELGLATYHVPLLYGYSSGANIVYAALAQSHGTFAGAVSIGFCPEQDYGGAELCAGAAGQLQSSPGKQGSIVLQPAAHLADPWVVLQGQRDRVCPAQAVDAFALATANAQVVRLARVAHRFDVEADWLPQFRAVYARLSRPALPAPAAGAVADLPLIEQWVPAAADAPLALLLTGDGGWASLDRGVAAALNARGVPAVGLSTLQYYWHVKTPEQSAADVARILRHYLAAWGRERVLLVGYSFGADVLPFIVARLPQDLRERIAGVTFLGLSRQANFEIRAANWLPGVDRGTLPTLPEIARLRGMPLLCVYGAGESRDPCPELGASGVAVERIGDGHHLGGDHAAIADAILRHSARAGAP